ncbi:MAG: hypothetical protein MJ095_04635 [Oscillospiraceae bacterium]|nr:hypothetical protein [Oscillospiraceae bacterium]
MENISKDFENAVTEALKMGFTAEELKKRIDEVEKHDKNIWTDKNN